MLNVLIVLQRRLLMFTYIRSANRLLKIIEIENKKDTMPLTNCKIEKNMH